MLSDIPTIFFPYYQNLWSIIKYKSDKDQLIWFRTMSKMMFENMERPKEPVVDFTTEDERTVWEAYNTILPALSKVMKISKFSTAEFKEKARLNGKKGGRPRKYTDCDSDSTASTALGEEDDTSFIPTAETARKGIPDTSDAVLAGLIATDSAKEARIAANLKLMKAKFPNLNAFKDWLMTKPNLNSALFRDENCRRYVFNRLYESSFCDLKTGEPITCLSTVVSKIANVFVKYRKEILERQNKGTKEATIATEEKQHEDALDNFYKSRLRAASATQRN